MKKFVFLCLTVIFLLSPAGVMGSRTAGVVPLDSWIYPALEKLAGLGLIHSDMQGMRPFSRLEAARQVLEARASKQQVRTQPVTHELLQRLEVALHEEITRLTEAGHAKTYFQPLRSTSLHYYYREGESTDIAGTNANQFPLNYNNFGIQYSEGSNGQLIVESEANFGGWLALNARPIYQIQEEGGGSLSLLEGRAALGLGPFEFSVGRQALWWGQGRHGALVLTNNAEPLDMLRVTNPSPVLLPWVFKFLGPLRFDLFVSELDEDRAVPEPYFGGLRVNIKPLPWLELGAARAVMFGGEGRPDVKLDDFLTIVGGDNLVGEEDTSNSVAALDARVKIPPLWGLELYGELGGEDEAGGFISQKAWLAGLYLPKIEPSGRTSLRIEYADLSHLKNNSGVWYRHSVYRSGYTYEEKILGHHLGGAAEDLFVQVEILFPRNLNLSLEFDYERRGVDQPVEEKHYQPAVALEWALQNRLRLQSRYAFDRVDNFAFEPGAERDFHLAELGLCYTW